MMDEREVAKALLEGKEVDFERLLDPYREGGTKQEPVERTWGKIVNWLVGKHRVPPDTVGAALIVVCAELKSGRTFDGDGSWGSKGRQLDQYIKEIAIRIEGAKEGQAIFALIGKRVFSVIREKELKRTKKNLKPWSKLWRSGRALIR